MSIKDQLTEDMKSYMRAKDQIGLQTVRMVKSEIKNVEIDKGAELDDEGVQAVIASAIKKRKDAADQFKEAGREDLCEKELAEVEILAKYMPEQLDEEAVKAIVKEVCAEFDATDKKNFGKAMQAVMAKVKGQADGKIVNKLVKDAFDGNL